MSERNLFDDLHPKTAFFIGFACSLGVMFAIGFFITLGMVTGGTTIERGSGSVAVAPTPSAPTAPTAPLPSNGQPPAVDMKNDRYIGAKNAKVTLIEFSDIQCPFCSRFHPTAKRIMEEYPNDVRWVYKHFPLDSIHPEARPAAEASECVADQKGSEAFFTYLDALFANQQSLSRTLYINEAKKLGVNETTFTNCLDSGKFKQKVENDYQQGIAAGVTGTPGSFVNTQVVRGALPYETIKQMVEQELNK